MTTETKPKLFLDLPILADLGEGYFLVAHPNGPAIMTECSIATLELAVVDPPRDGEMFNDEVGTDGDIPIAVGRLAIRKYVDWSWAQVSVPTN